ncbi:MAG: NapC/NirT family cytochrome c [Desulfovibrio sp.]|nr:NapC/NirT family cytochrome c [Desulfovibrio sp.]
MGEKSNSYRKAAVALGVFVVLCAVSGYALHATSTMEFCSSACHEMEIYAEELRYSAHAKDADGNVIDCVQCHIPAGFGPKYLAVKSYSGLKDLLVHFAETPESLDRAARQPVARRFIDDGNCLSCHEDLYKDARKEKAISELGKIAHDNYLGKNGKARSNCAGCHINMAHLPDFDRRLDPNKKFAERMDKKEALR